MNLESHWSVSDGWRGRPWGLRPSSPTAERPHTGTRKLFLGFHQNCRASDGNVCFFSFSLSWSWKQRTHPRPLKALHFLGSGVCDLSFSLPISRGSGRKCTWLFVFGVFLFLNLVAFSRPFLVFHQQALAACLLGAKPSGTCRGPETHRRPAHASRQVVGLPKSGKVAGPALQDHNGTLSPLHPYLLVCPTPSCFLHLTSNPWMFVKIRATV